MINFKTSTYLQIKERLREILDDTLFYNLMDEAIDTLSDVELLECAEMVKTREKGGVYYHNKSWAIVSRRNNDKKLNKIGKNLNVSPQSIKSIISKGNLILEAEQQGYNTEPLKILSDNFFMMARKRKEKALSYVLSAIDFINKKTTSNDNDQITINNINKDWCAKEGSLAKNLDIIKPSDWWAFGHPKWEQEDDFKGSIPGEIYANALYYFAPIKGIAVDAMAGSGMLKRVYNDRRLWQKDLNFNLDIRLYDMFPRRSFIEFHDSTTLLPMKADWIFIDPPYFNNDNMYDGFMAETKSYDKYLKYLSDIINAMYNSLNPNGRLCVFLPKFIDSDKSYDIPKETIEISKNVGFKWIDNAYVSRGRQRQPAGAINNIYAKKNRRMLSDVCELNVFEKEG